MPETVLSKISQSSIDKAFETNPLMTVVAKHLDILLTMLQSEGSEGFLAWLVLIIILGSGAFWAGRWSKSNDPKKPVEVT